MRLATLGAGVLVLLAGTFASADQLVLKNGNTLTGTVTESDGKVITFDSALAGTVKVKIEDIKSVTTDAPVHIKLADGSKVDGALTAAGDGQANINGKATPLSNIAGIKVGPVKWTGDLTISAAITRGNSYTDSANVTASAIRRSDQDRITLEGGYLYGRQKEKGSSTASTTAENWFAQGKYDYFLNEKLYVFGAARFEQDHIADLEYRITPSAGLGYQWFETSTTTFDTELGLAYVYEKYSPVPAGGESDNGQFSARAAYHLTHKFSETVSAFHNLTIFPSVEDVSDFFLTTDAGIRASLTKKMFAQLKVQVDYDATPAAGAKKFNQYFLLGVGWTF